ncbi:MAG: hypothetical protein WC596_04105 [Candidatus Shapirobacteria bacterium]
MTKKLKQKKEPPDNNQNLLTPIHNGKSTWKWRAWHEREIPVKVNSSYVNDKIYVKISSSAINKLLTIRYPQNLWKSLPASLKNKLLNNIAYAYTAHFPLVIDKNVRLEFNTEYPQVYSWSNQSFMKFLPAYWYMHSAKRGTHILPILKTILNTTHTFKATNNENFSFSPSNEKYVVLPFTFGKDSFLTYHLVKRLGFKPILFWVNDPLSPYESKHKLDLFNSFSKEIHDPIICVDSELETLRDLGMSWFGWEIPLTAWAILAIPIARQWKAKYIIFSNERSTEAFFYDHDGLKVVPDYEQSTQAVDEISLLTQSLSNGNVFTTSFLQGLDEITIISILAEEFSKNTFKNLMSCGSAHECAESRWCGKCSKCARLYLYLSANGINPLKEVGFGENMFKTSKQGLYNVFGQTAAGSLFDAFGLNTEEQAFAFYLCYLRGIKDPLVNKFTKTKYFKDVENRFDYFLNEYYRQHEERVTPSVCKQALSKLCEGILARVRKKAKALHKAALV